MPNQRQLEYFHLESWSLCQLAPLLLLLQLLSTSTFTLARNLALDISRYFTPVPLDYLADIVVLKFTSGTL